MRQSEAAVALIRQQADGRPNFDGWPVGIPKWQAFHFVAGHRRPEESFRACLVREIGEELGLREGEDYTVLTAPALHVDFTAWSVSARAETRYVMELFDVELMPAAQSRIAADPENRWLAEAEITSWTLRGRDDRSARRWAVCSTRTGSGKRRLPTLRSLSGSRGVVIGFSIRFCRHRFLTGCHPLRDDSPVESCSWRSSGPSRPNGTCGSRWPRRSAGRMRPRASAEPDAAATDRATGPNSFVPRRAGGDHGPAQRHPGGDSSRVRRSSSRTRSSAIAARRTCSSSWSRRSAGRSRRRPARSWSRSGRNPSSSKEIRGWNGCRPPGLKHDLVFLELREGKALHGRRRKLAEPALRRRAAVPGRDGHRHVRGGRARVRAERVPPSRCRSSS